MDSLTFNSGKKVVTYNIERVGVSRKDYLWPNDSMQYQIQRLISEAKFDALKFMIGDGYVPCNAADIEVEVRLLQNALPAEATDGRVMQIESNYAVSVLKYEYKDWLDTSHWA